MRRIQSHASEIKFLNTFFYIIHIPSQNIKYKAYFLIQNFCICIEIDQKITFLIFKNVGIPVTSYSNVQ